MHFELYRLSATVKPGLGAPSYVLVALPPSCDWLLRRLCLVRDERAVFTWAKFKDSSRNDAMGNPN